ncbi:MAG: hypothetical protein JWO06_1664 [Bacteroidota bacterium]|nr:hypothetical protein [Bacteroidota bacterium]
MFIDKKQDYCKMANALLDLQYLPSVSWLVNFMKYENIWIEGEENFVKSSFRNRCEIVGSGGKIVLSIPLQGGRDHHQKYKDTKISYQSDWRNNHWQSILSAYGSAPYFEFYCEKFQQFYEKEPVLLFDFNLALLAVILNVLKLQKEFRLTDIYEKESADKIDLRSKRASTLDVSTLNRYYQVFEDKHGFIPNLSIIDLIFHLGPDAKRYLQGLINH